MVLLIAVLQDQVMLQLERAQQIQNTRSYNGDFSLQDIYGWLVFTLITIGFVLKHCSVLSSTCFLVRLELFLCQDFNISFTPGEKSNKRNGNVKV